MLGMRVPIDVAFLDGSARVGDTVPRLRPWVPVRLAPGAAATLELPAGALSASGTQAGDDLVIEPLT